MAMLHVREWTAKDDPGAYDDPHLYVPQSVELWIGYEPDGIASKRFKLWPKPEVETWPVVLREGRYTQVRLARVYVSVLQQAVSHVA